MRCNCVENSADGLPQKLQPFFPPLDQLQSTNLRAALLRCLDQAKKNGVLGRDTVLRKTMLDECRGERLEEILAVFSSVVLKKVVDEQQLSSKKHPAAAKTLALEKRGHLGERSQLNPLILAHKASLRTKLDHKAASRSQYKDFAGLLDSKERSISERRKLVATKTCVPTISDEERSAVRRAVRNNWAGSEQWMEALLCGDTPSRKDGLFTAPFDRVWRRMRSGRLGELEDETGGLLEQLDKRVHVQQERLGKWQNFRREMFGNVSDQPQRKDNEQFDRQKGIDLGFGAHESLQLGSTGLKKLTGVKHLPMEGDYRDLLKGLESELRDINQSSATYSLGWLRDHTQPLGLSKQRSSSEKIADESVSELSELEEELAKPPVATKRPLSDSSQQRSEGSTDTEVTSKHQQRFSRPKLHQPLSSMQVFRPKSLSTEISPTEPSMPHLPMGSKPSSPRRSPVRAARRKSPSPTRSPTRNIPPSPFQSQPRNSPPRRTQSPEELPPSPTQMQADQILASMTATSPSPVKQPRHRHTLSLAERTRLSMARGSSADLDDEDEIAIGSPTRLSRRNTSSRSPKKNKPTTPNPIPEDGPDPGLDDTAENDLVARTRKSMANYEVAQQKARLEMQRSQKRAARQQSGSIARQTYFPSVDEEGDAAGDDNSTVVLEELIAKEAESAQGVDYDLVFKSRPKIKTSPPSTPIRRTWEDEENM